MEGVTALERRPFKFKNPVLSFFCPLCRSKRALPRDYRLFPRHYFQMILLTLMTLWVTHPLMEFRGLFSFFVYWPLFELGRRVLYRKDIPCPYCGFDAVWYRRDVKVARKVVRKFWQKTPTESPTQDGAQ